MAKKSNGFPMDFSKIMFQQAQKSVDSPVYCRFCGKNVKEPTSNSPRGSNGAWAQHLDWETENHSHVSCANKARGRR
jgi:hypothetical protein